MVCSERTTSTNNTSTTNSTPSTSNSSLSPPLASAPPVILSPCAACKILRRRCADKCILAPYFPPTDPLRFTIAHRVFGASNIIKLLQELPEHQREDAVSSIVYEANARIRDPVYGCAGAICHLQRQVSELQAELAKAQAEVVHLQSQQSNLVTLFCMEVSQSHDQEAPKHHHDHHHHQQEQVMYDHNSANFSVDDGDFAPSWDSLDMMKNY